MRRYDIVTGILLILSIIDFALAAPVLVQEKRQERVDVGNVLKDVSTMLGKRWEEELEKVGEEYFKTSGKSIDSSGTHASSSSAPYPASSTPNPDRSTGSCCSPSGSSSTSMRGLSARGNQCWTTCVELVTDMSEADIPLHGVGRMVYTSSLGNGYRKLPTTEAPAPQSMSSADPDFDWEYWTNAPESPPKPVMPTGEASGYAPGPPPAEPLTVPEKEVVPGPPPSPDPKLNHQSLSAGSQPVDLEATVYDAKGKAKESRHITGTAGDVGN